MIMKDIAFYIVIKYRMKGENNGRRKKRVM